MLITQKGNQAGGDIIGGDQMVYAPSVNTANFYSASAPFAALYARLRVNDAADAHTSRIAEELQHYCSISTDGDVRGLAEKLASSGRSHMLPTAQRLKQIATKTVMRLQTSPAAQAILTLILSKMYTDFLVHVTPAIEADATRQEIDKLIGDKVIDSAVAMLGDNDLLLSSADMLGLLFFLAGNCHIRWDKC